MFYIGIAEVRVRAINRSRNLFTNFYFFLDVGLDVRLGLDLGLRLPICGASNL